VPPPIRHAAAFGIAYRPMRDADLPFIETLYISTRLEEVAATGWPEAQQLAFLSGQHRAQHSHYRIHYAQMEWLIVEQAGAAIGRLYLDQWPSQWRIVDISLMPESRGRGLGAAIMRDIIDMAGANGKGVSIHVEKNNPARHLYDRLGFGFVEDKGVYDLLEWRPAA
jgi:ribosomal protein S18 acetylase RimI-like enzyme